MNHSTSTLSETIESQNSGSTQFGYKAVAGFRVEIARIEKLVSNHLIKIVQAWNEYFGH